MDIQTFADTLCPLINADAATFVEDQGCIITVGGYDIAIEWLAATDSLCFYTKVANGPDNEKLHTLLLQINLLNTTKDCFFGLDDQHNNIYLITHVLAKHLDVLDCLAALATFIDNAIFWLNKIHSTALNATL